MFDHGCERLRNGHTASAVQLSEVPNGFNEIQTWLGGHLEGRLGIVFFAALLASRAATAFFALALRSSVVKPSQALLPPILPPFAPCCLKYSSTSGGSFFSAIDFGT